MGGAATIVGWAVTTVVLELDCMPGAGYAIGPWGWNPIGPGCWLYGGGGPADTMWVMISELFM